jgi:hypothetical protein
VGLGSAGTPRSAAAAGARPGRAAMNLEPLRKRVRQYLDQVRGGPGMGQLVAAVEGPVAPRGGGRGRWTGAREATRTEASLGVEPCVALEFGLVGILIWPNARL